MLGHKRSFQSFLNQIRLEKLDIDSKPPKHRNWRLYHNLTDYSSFPQKTSKDPKYNISKLHENHLSILTALNHLTT